MLELVQLKLKVHGTKGWRGHEGVMLTLHLAWVYMILGAKKEALPLVEDLVHKYHNKLGLGDQCWATESLAECYTYVRKWKQAREMIEKACKHSKDIRGSDDTITRNLVMTRQDIFQSSYNDAISHGMEDISDGITLEIDGYRRGAFKVSVKSIRRRNLRQFRRSGRSSHYGRRFRCCPSQSQGSKAFEWKTWHYY